jgi:exodeoxyribonuclease V alpha subunit
MSSVAGEIQKRLFNQNGFYILSIDVDDSEDPKVDDKIATVKGLLPGLIQVQPGIQLRFLGKWTKHKRHGRQFKIKSWEPWAKNTQGIEAFLRVCVEGFTDELISKALTKKYGLETFNFLTEHPAEVLSETFEGVSPESLRQAVRGWGRVLAAKNLHQLLSGDFSSVEIELILAKFGLDAPDVLRENPYRLMEIPGFRFDKVDQMASTSLGISLSDPRRLCGAILWTLQEAAQDGNLFLRRGDIPESLRSLKIGDFDYDACAEAILKLVSQKAVVIDPEVGVYLPSYHRYERESARLLSRMRAPLLDIDADTFLKWYESTFNIELSELQRRSVETLIQHRVLVLTGLPGTGKTMVVRTFVSLFERAGLTYSLMAPTGIAAKRLAAVTGKPAGTIHRLLRYNGSEWEYGPGRIYPANAVIVDEMSMVDQELFYRLLSALSPDTMLVLVGDAAQLPSVGPGNVLRELVNCSLPNIKLTQIFRQSEKGAIVRNSHLINQGEMPILEDPKKAIEFKFVRCSDEAKIAEFIVELAARLKAKDANFQVLSPKYDGTVGVNNLNDLLRSRLNPLRSQREWKHGLLHFREGDRLMIVKNDYNLGVYNGDVGKFLRLEKEDYLMVRVYGANGVEEGVVTFSEGEALAKLRLAYAVTVHKSQGNEFDTILLPIVKSQGRMLQRNLLYTAITRARKRVWLIGEESAIYTAVKNDRVVKRNTVLANLTSALLSGVEVVANGS